MTTTTNDLFAAVRSTKDRKGKVPAGRSKGRAPAQKPPVVLATHQPNGRRPRPKPSIPIQMGGTWTVRPEVITENQGRAAACAEAACENMITIGEYRYRCARTRQPHSPFCAVCEKEASGKLP